MSSCSTGKRRYLTESLAVDALIEARSTFLHNSAVGVYQCQECGDWHMTSQGETHPKLKDLLESGKLDNIRESREWERKLKRS